jgi:MFS transporter, PAT family, beta-lactamase induction signal transducer AmpG
METSQQKYLLLGSLYTAQYLPIGFYDQALPVLLRQQGYSLKTINLVYLLALPWMLKFLWSPIVDSYGFHRWGHYRGWIIVLESLLVSIVVAIAIVDLRQNFPLLLITFFAICLISATQDVATDALGVQFLKPHERGMGNGIQNAANFFGAILGGGLMLILLDRWGWTISFLLMAIALALPLVFVLPHREKSVKPTGKGLPNFKAIADFFYRPQIKTWLLVLFVYQMGSSMASAMLKPFLVDIGLSLQDIGSLNSLVGYTSGLIGSLVGGLLLNYWGYKRGLINFALFNAIGVACLLIPASIAKDLSIIYLVVALHQFTVGMATTVMMALMMSQSRLETAGTDYTLQTSLQTIGGIGAIVVGGAIADGLGYTNFFGLCTLVCLLGVFLCFKLLTWHSFWQGVR